MLLMLVQLLVLLPCRGAMLPAPVMLAQLLMLVHLLVQLLVPAPVMAGPDRSSTSSVV